MSKPAGDQVPYALAVDDDALILMDAAVILEDAGFRALQAHDGDEAIAMLAADEHERVVLVFTDVQMPGSRDGFAMAREVAALYPDIAIIMASGQIKPKPGDLPAGARFIAKPFSAETVHAHLQEILPDGRKPEQLRRRAPRQP